MKTLTSKTSQFKRLVSTIAATSHH